MVASISLLCLGRRLGLYGADRLYRKRRRLKMQSNLGRKRLAAAFWLGAIDSDSVPPLATQLVAARLLSDLDDEIQPDEIETIQYERDNGYGEL